MRRRNFLKLSLPLAALLAGCGPSPSVDCSSNIAERLRRLRRFADPLLGKMAALSLSKDAPKPEVLQSLCEADFASRYRQQVAADFAAGKTLSLDGWVVSETEAFTHRLVYLLDASPGVGSGP
jgi:hypothetical protein